MAAEEQKPYLMVPSLLVKDTKYILRLTNKNFKFLNNLWSGTMFEEFRKAEGHTYGQRNFVLEVLKDQLSPNNKWKILQNG